MQLHPQLQPPHHLPRSTLPYQQHGETPTRRCLISGPEVGTSGNSRSDLVENTSPRNRSPLELVEALSPSSHSNLKLVEALSPSYCSRLELVEILSPSHYITLGLKEVLFPSLKTIATRCLITSSRPHAQLVLTSSSK